MIKTIIASSLSLLILTGCGGGDSSNPDSNDSGSTQNSGSTGATKHILSQSVEKKDNTFTLHATYSSPEYVGVSSISPASLESSMKIFEKLRSTAETKSVDEGYSIDVKCTYEYESVASEDYYKLKCDDLNDNSDSLSERTLKSDYILTARWTEYGKTEYLSFGALSDYTSKTASENNSTSSNLSDEGTVADESNSVVKVNILLFREINDSEFLNIVDSSKYPDAYWEYSGESLEMYPQDTYCSNVEESYKEELKSKNPDKQLIITSCTQKDYGTGDYRGAIVTSSTSEDTMNTEINSPASNVVPIANVGTSKALDANVSYSIILDGSASSDADNDTLSYIWSIKSKPTNSEAILNDDTTVAPKFKADLEGAYEISLIVNDGTDDSVEDTLTITATKVISASSLKYNTSYAHTVGKLHGASLAANDVKISGNYAYIVNRYSGHNSKVNLEVIDISNRETPSIIGSLDLENFYPSNTGKIDIVGNYAYVSYAKRTSNYTWDRDIIKIIDISNKTSPFVINTYIPDSKHINDIEILGNYAYISQNGDGICILDISNPISPLKVKQITGLDAEETKISGNYAYVASWNHGLSIYDISNPEIPTFVTAIDTKSATETSNYARGVEISGNYAFVSDTYSGLKIINISDPASPVWAGEFYSIGNNDIEIVDNYAYLGTNNGFKILNISNLSSISLLGEIYGSCTGVEISGDYAYLSGTDELRVLDISKKVAPKRIGNVSITVSYDVEISRNYAYIANGSGGFKIIDTSIATSPSLVGEIATTDARDIALFGNYAYVADYGESVKVIDISDSTSPSIVGGVAIVDAQDIEISGNYAYVSDRLKGLKVLDLSNPVSPSVVGELDIDQPGKIDISGNYLFITDYRQGLKIVDISNPKLPSIVGEYRTDFINNVKISGNYAYIKIREVLSVIDITDKKNPFKINNVNTVSSFNDLKIFGNYAISVDGALEITDITNPEEFVSLGKINLSNGRDVEISGNYAYTVDNSGFVIVDISQLMN